MRAYPMGIAPEPPDDPGGVSWGSLRLRTIDPEALHSRILGSRQCPRQMDF